MTSERTRGDDLTRALSAALGSGSAVIGPAEADWDQRRLGWNLAQDQRPAAIVEVSRPTDVACAVRAATDLGYAVSAQSGGHGATRGLDDTVLVRTSALSELRIDPATRTAHVGAGVRWGDVLDALDGTGLVGLAGSAPDISVTGFVLGGGMSWVGRRFGRGGTVLRSAEMVGADGRLRHVTDDSDPDLMWALRGGGGDLGIVTSLEIDLLPAPDLYGGKLLFPATDAKSVLTAWLQLTHSAPRELTAWVSVVHLPDLPQLPPPLRGRSFVAIDVLFLGSAGPAEELLAGVRKAGTVLHDTVGTVGPGQLGRMAEEPSEPTPSADWSSTLRRLDEDAIARLIEVVGDRAETPLFMVQLRHLGGAFADGDRTRMVGARLADPYLLFAFGIAAPATTGPLQASFAALAEALAPELSGRTPLTFLPAGASVHRAFDDTELDRLRAIKRAVDPEGMIRGNHPLLADGAP